MPVPVEHFEYDPVKNKFRYLPTGAIWRRPGVDAVVGPIQHNGKMMRATEWLKLGLKKTAASGE